MNRQRVGRRRLIPIAVAIAFGLAASLPLWGVDLGERRVNRWTLLIVVVMFAFKAVLFGWMRRRMVTHPKPLTVFGQSLVDFFTALVIGDVAIAAVFGVAWWYARHERPAPFWLRTSDRAALIGTVAYVIGTGVAVAWEMRIAGLSLAVHAGDDDGISPLPVSMAPLPETAD